MTPAALFAALALTLPPSPWHVDRAEALIRNPEIDAPTLTESDRPALWAAARRLELLGRDDLADALGELGVEYGRFDAESLLAFLRSYQTDLVSAPPLAEAARLPCAAACRGAAELNRKLADNWRLLAAWEPDRAARYAAAAQEADWHSEFWSSAGYAASAVVPVADRRRCLAAVRDHIGQERWAAGDIPDFAPAHLFRAR